MKQDILYYNLSQVLDKDYCPICYWVNQAVRGYFENMLYEMVNDHELSENLQRSGGFCREHANELLSFGDPLGQSIIYSGILEHLTNEFANLKSSEILRKKGTINPSKDACPACLKAQETEDRYIFGLVRSLQDNDFRVRFSKSMGLCIPHFISAIRMCPNEEVFLAIKETQLNAMSALLKELKEIIRKFDYRYAHEPMTREKDAWIRAVNYLAGVKGGGKNKD